MDMETGNNSVVVSSEPKRKGRRVRERNRSRGIINPSVTNSDTPITDSVNNGRWQNGKGNNLENNGVADNKQAEDALITSDLDSVRTLGLSYGKNSEEVPFTKLACLGIGDDETWGTCLPWCLSWCLPWCLPDNKLAEDALITSDLNSVRTLGLSDGKNSKEVPLAELVCLGIGDEESSPSKTAPSLSIRVPITYVRRKLLILDLNGVLVDLVCRPPKEYKVDIRIAKQAGLKRPFCDDFLNFCFERFEVGIWSSRLKKNIDKLVNFLLGDMKQKLLFCWDLSHCTATKFGTLEDRRKPVVFKEVRRIWEKHEPEFPWKKGFYNESNTLLLDDSPYKALLNPANTAIFPYSYQFQNESDNSLGVGGDLRVYLEDLSVSDSVQEFVEKHPFGQSPVTEKSASWGFYRGVITSLQPSPVAQIT